MNDYTPAADMIVPSATPGHYMPQGYMQWPDNSEYSFQFMRALGAAQEGASMISECFLAGSRIVAGDDESWNREWKRLAETSLKRAEDAIAAGHRQTAGMNWLRAANYFRSAEFFLDHDDPRRLELLDSIEGCSQKYMKHLIPGSEVVKVPYENGAHLDAYFLRAPDPLERQPTVICFGGLDEFKDELLHEIPKHALTRGISVLLVDLPGQGATLRRQKLTTRFDTEVPVTACVDYLVGRDDVDPERLGLYGASIGGYYAPRAASFEHRFKAVVSDGAIWKLGGGKNAAQVPNPKSITMRHMHWVLGVPGAGTEEGLPALREKIKNFNLEGVQDKIRCPYLITEGECDFVGFDLAVESYEYSKRHGQDVTFKVFTAEETGAAHCQCDNPTLGQEYIFDWLAEKLGVDQMALPPIQTWN